MKITANNFLYIQRKENDILKEFYSSNDTELVDPEKRTALINAAFYNNTELLEWLISKGANINAQDCNGYSALHFACQEGHLDSVKILLKNHANVNIVDNYGNTPACATIMHWRGGRNLPILQELYKYNADLSIKNKAGNSVANILPANIMEKLVR